MSYSRTERLALSELLDTVGPDAPTLCEGWRTRDLAAHLVIREHRPDAAAGVMGGPLAGHTARVQKRYLDRFSYSELIAMFRAGPPRFSPLALPRVDEAANTVEYFVHHEDVRRAAENWEPRELDPGLAEALWSRLKGARLFLRKAPVGIELARDDAPSGGREEDTAGQATGAGQVTAAGQDNGAGRDTGGGNPPRIAARKATPLVTVSGTPAELTLWAMGRLTASTVRFEGPKAAINQLQAWRR